MSPGRGQAAVEYMLVLGLLLLVVSFIGYFEFSETQRSIDSLLVEDAVASVARAADTVYSMGPCSRTYADIRVPESVVGSFVGGRMVGYNLASGGDVFAVTLADPIGYLPWRGGGHRVPVYLSCSGVLLVGDGLSLAPARAQANLSDGSSQVLVFNLTNGRDQLIGGLSSGVTGDEASWFTVNGLSASILGSSSESFNVTVAVPSGTYSGSYHVRITVTGSGALAESAIVVYVAGASTTTTSTTTSSTTTSSSTTSSTVSTTTSSTTTTVSTTSSSTSTTVSTTSSSTTSSTTTTTVVNCTPWCSTHGFTTGVCRQSAAQCTVNGESYLSGGNSQCTGGPTVDKCCCV